MVQKGADEMLALGLETAPNFIRALFFVNRQHG